MVITNITYRLIAAVCISVIICTAVLAEGKHFHEKGKLPSKHTLKVFEQARASLPFSDRPSIAGLPFTNISGDAEQEYFADGMI